MTTSDFVLHRMASGGGAYLGQLAEVLLAYEAEGEGAYEGEEEADVDTDEGSVWSDEGDEDDGSDGSDEGDGSDDGFEEA